MRLRFQTWHTLMAVGLAVSCVALSTANAMSDSPQAMSRKRVVMLMTGTGNCTGVILQTNMVLTCAHCVKPNTTLNKEQVKIAKIDHEIDLAILLVKTPTMERIKLAECEPTQEVHTWGHPMGDTNIIFSKGYVMSVQEKTILTSTICLPGDSGSPLFASDGSLLGITRGAMGNGVDYPIAMTIPSTTIKKFLNW